MMKRLIVTSMILLALVIIYYQSYNSYNEKNRIEIYYEISNPSLYSKDGDDFIEVAKLTGTFRYEIDNIGRGYYHVDNGLYLDVNDFEKNTYYPNEEFIYFNKIKLNSLDAFQRIGHLYLEGPVTIEDENITVNLDTIYHLDIIDELPDSYRIAYHNLILDIDKSQTKREMIYTERMAHQTFTFMYHNIVEDSEDVEVGKYDVTTTNFERHLKYLSRDAWYVANLIELYEWINDEIELPYQTGVITFDDGHISNYELAYPLLKKYDLHAVYFLISSYLNNPHILYTNQIEEMAADGLIDIQSHSHDMHRLTCDEGEKIQCVNKEEFASDLDSTIKKIYNQDSFLVYSFPGGIYNEMGMNTLREYGFKMAFRTKPGPIVKGDNLYKLKRMYVGNTNTIENYIMWDTYK